MFRQPDVMERLNAQGMDLVGSTPEQFSAFMKNEVVKWARIVKVSGARVD